MTHDLWAALAATAAELMRRPGPRRVPVEPECCAYRVELGELSVIAPPGSLDGRPLAWPGPPVRTTTISMRAPWHARAGARETFETNGPRS